MKRKIKGRKCYNPSIKCNHPVFKNYLLIDRLKKISRAKYFLLYGFRIKKIKP